MQLRVCQRMKNFPCQDCYKYQILKKSYQVTKTVTIHLRAFTGKIIILAQHRNSTQRCKQHTYLDVNQKQKTPILLSTCNELFILINYGILTTWSVITVRMDHAWGMLWWLQCPTNEVQRQNLRAMRVMQKELQRKCTKICYYCNWIIA